MTKFRERYNRRKPTKEPKIRKPVIVTNKQQNLKLGEQNDTVGLEPTIYYPYNLVRQEKGNI